MIRIFACLGALLALVVVAPAFAQTAGPQAETPSAPLGEVGRFTFSPVAGGVLRLDTRTGRVSLCHDEGGWICEAVADDRTAYEKEIERLQDKVAALEAAAKRKGRDPPATMSESEIDRAMNFLEGMYRRFLGMIKDLHREAPADQI